MTAKSRLYRYVTAKSTLFYPGSEENIQEDVDAFNRDLQLELKKEAVVTFAFIHRNAFAPPRLSDRIILQRQRVQQA